MTPARHIYQSLIARYTSHERTFISRSSGLLQLTGLRHHRRFDEPAAVCPECGCTFGVGRTTLQPHHASATGAALASGSMSGGFQDDHPGLYPSVTVRHGSSLSSRRLSVVSWSPTTVVVSCVLSHQSLDVCCQTDLQQLGRQVFCSCRSAAVEQPSY